MTRVAAAALGGGVALTGIYFALPMGGLSQSVYYDAFGGLCAAGILAGTRLNRPPAPLPWVLFALGNASFVVGDVLFNLAPNAQSPSTADGFYLAGYPLLAAGLVLLILRAGGHHRRAAMSEAAVATVAFALIQWVFVMHPDLEGAGGLAARAVSATYPAADVVLLAGFAGFFASSVWRRTAFVLLVGAVALLLVGDEVNGLSPSTYSSGSWVDSTWLLSYVLFAVAALHPSMRQLGEPRPSTGVRVSAWRIGLLTAALLTPPGVLLTQWLRGGRLEVPAVVAATALIALLVVWRLTGMLRALEQAREATRASEERLLAQNEQLLEADRLKDEFVALISHDLRTPLTSIIGYTELALEEDDSGPLGEERRSYLEVVSRSSERLLRLVDDLLFVARLQAGKRLELTMKDLDIAVVAAQSVVEAQPRAEARELHLRLASSGPVPVRADRGRIFQLLDNLIANAIKFTPPGGLVEVYVGQENGGAVLEVRDTGVGLDPEEAARLFDRFYRTAAAIAAQVPGTGLGLYIARAITEAHGGRISAGAREGGGTVFRIELPSATPARSGEPELVA